MDISTHLNGDKVEILLVGKMKDYDEYIELKNTIKQHTNKPLVFYFINAYPISPYILGYILKLKEINKLNIDIIVNNARLYNTLHNIEFDNFFDIKIKE